MVDPIQNQIQALEQELEAYEQRGMDERAEAVREQLQHYRELAKERDEIAGELLDPTATKRAAADVALAEARALELARTSTTTTPNNPEAANAARPALNGTTEEWRAFAARPDVELGTDADAGRDAIVAAYIGKFAPGGNASTEDWVKYASEHGVSVDGKNRDEARAAVADAGWAQPVQAKADPAKRTTEQNKPQQTRGN